MPYPIPPEPDFLPGPSYRTGDTIAQLMLRRGQIAAEAAARSGDLWRNAIGNIGNIASGAFQQYGQQQNEADVNKAITRATMGRYPSATQSNAPGSGMWGGGPAGDPTAMETPANISVQSAPRATSHSSATPVQSADSGMDHLGPILDSVSPELRPRVLKGIQDFQDAASKSTEARLKVQDLRQKVMDAQKASEQHDRNTAAVGAYHVKQHMDGPDGGLSGALVLWQQSKAAGLPGAAQFDDFMSNAMQTWQQVQDDPAKKAEFAKAFNQQAAPYLQRLIDGGDPATIKGLSEEKQRPVSLPEGAKLVDPVTGATVAEGAPKETNLQHVETSAGIQTFDPKTGKLGPVIAKGKPPASTIINPASEADAKDSAEQLASGRILPTDLSKRGASYNHILAEANRISLADTGKPLNINKLKLDYESAKRFAGTMNGSQMVRFKGLADSVVNTIDEVRSLADELKQGGIQKWNKVKRGTIQQVYGNTPQSELAARYVGAVNTLKEEFANLAQGGFAPSEATWKLANEQINGDYGFKDMNASLSEVQRLINFRVGAFSNMGPTYVGGAPGQVTTATPASATPAIPAIAPSATAAPKKISTKAEMDALPSGAHFIGPDGQERIKP